MAKNYRLVPVDLDATWDAFIGASPDASVFIASNYLAHTGCRLGLYRCYNADELRALLAVVESPDGSMAVLDDLVIYSGICMLLVAVWAWRYPASLEEWQRRKDHGEKIGWLK